jgi:hypothetical protein
MTPRELWADIRRLDGSIVAHGLLFLFCLPVLLWDAYAGSKPLVETREHLARCEAREPDHVHPKAGQHD